MENPIRLKQSILAVDDNTVALTVERLMLEAGGYTVSTAQSGTEAIALLSKMERPDLILLDMQMEDMTGLEFLNVLAEKNPEVLKRVPIVFLSGMNEVPKSRAVGFIRKPVDMDQFLKAVERFIDMGNHVSYRNA